MKRILALLLCALLILSGCGQDKAAGSKVFDTDREIKSIVFETTINGRKEIPVPEEYLPEVIEWLGSFTVGKQVGDSLSPGTNATRVTIVYADGTSMESALDTVTVGRKTYYTEEANMPDAWYDYYSGIVNSK